MGPSSKNMFTSSEVDQGRKGTSEQEIVYCLRLTKQRQYPYTIRFLDAAIGFCAVVTEEKREMKQDSG